MHIVQEQQRRFTVIQRSQMVLTTTHFLATLRGTQKTMAHRDLLPMERNPSAASLPTDLACTTWQAMLGSGARIGMGFIHQQASLTPQDPRLVWSICFVAAPGAPTPTTAVRRCATTARPTLSATASGSVSQRLRRDIAKGLCWNKRLIQQ